MSTTGMVKYEEIPAELVQWRNPEVVLAEATQAAEALKRVIALKEKPVIFNNEQYLEFEDWQTVAKFYGITAKAVGSRYVDYGGVTGWEAEAVALRSDGVEISRAESMCMTDEDNWGDVPVYEWQDVLVDGKKVWDQTLRNGKGGYKATRVKVDSKPKPMFQLRSMAQTRACAKALRHVLSWVVVLGGFKANVAEEMIESQLGPTEPANKKEEKTPIQQPQRASQAVVDTVGGVIESAKFGRNEVLWITIPDVKLIMVPKEHVREDMLEKQFLSAEVKLAKSEKIGEYWVVQKVIKCEPVEDLTGGDVEEGEYVDEDGSAADATQETTAKVDTSELNELFATGGVKKASELPKQDLGSDGKPKIIGPKRAQRLHILISTNHKTTGFTEDELKKLLHTPPLNLDHLRDLPYHMYEVVEKFATGENTDWKES